jgi:hypothetical protein
VKLPPFLFTNVRPWLDLISSAMRSKSYPMKNIFTVLFILIVASSSLFAQQEPFICAMEDDTSPDPQGVFSYSINPLDLTNFEPKVFNIYFWQINDSNGNYGDNINVLTEEKVLEAVANYNITFNKYKIFFKYKGFGQFNSPPNVIPREYNPQTVCLTPTFPQYDPDGYETLDRCQITEMYNFAENNGYKDTNAFNVYVPRTTTGFGGSGEVAGTSTIIGFSRLNSGFGHSHELGHSLGLSHTHSTSERVTRDPNDSIYNADTHGDRVVDTAASLSLYKSGGANNGYPYLDTVNCLYIGDEVNPVNQDEYENTIFHEDVINLMSYAFICWEPHFSTGQAIRMHERVAADPYNIYAQTLNTIASLFEPYKGEYYYAGPLLPGESTPLFQPGFTYRFVECSGNFPAPAPYGTVFSYNITTMLNYIEVDETDYSQIYHPNHSAISIQEVDEAKNTTEVQKCYNNYNSNPDGGVLIKFNDGVFNTNVTVTPQDSTQINNPQMINNLQPGLYNVIENYNDGSTQETVIIKENN